MWIAIIILVIIWSGLLIPVIQERHAWIAFAHGGSGLFFTSLLLNLGLHQTGKIGDIVWLKIIGFILLIPAIILIVSAIIAITHEKLVQTGMNRIVRHPMYLGTAVAAFAIVLIFQSILSLILSVIAIVLLWIASIMEDKYNIEQFGESYRDYMANVPRWNIFKSTKKRT